MTTTISPLPMPPTPADSPVDFNAKAFALLGGLPTFVAEANAQAAGLDASVAAAGAQATIATTKAGEALTSADNAALSKIGADGARDASVAAKNAASATLAEIRNHYYGPLAADPVTRPDGSAVQVGDEYQNTATHVRRVYADGAWRDATVAATEGLAVTPLKFMSPEMRADALSGAPTLDHAVAIQAALDSGMIVIIDEVYLTSGNEVPSGSHMIFAGNGKIKLASGANRPVLQNVNWQKSTWGGSTFGVDSDITIEGLNIDGNQANQVHHLTSGQYAGEYISGVRFFGVKNLTMKRTTISNARTFGIWLAAIDGLVFEGAYFNQYIGGTPDNQDGLHINGPARNLFIRNLYGYTNDDLLALNADDAPLGSNVTSGAITDVVVDGVSGIGALNGIRVLSAVSRIDRVKIKNVIGSYRDPAVNLSAYNLGAGNFGTITIDGVDAVCTNPYFGPNSDYYGVIVLDDHIESVNIRNINRSKASDARPLVDVRPGAVINKLNLDGVTHRTDVGGIQNETVLSVSGTIDVLNMRGLDWYKDNAVASGGRVVYVTGGSVGQLNGSDWSTRRLGNIVEVPSGRIDTIRLQDVLDLDSATAGAVVLLSNATEAGMYLRDIRTNPGRAVARTTNSASIWKGSVIDVPSGAGAYMSANQAIGSAGYATLQMNARVYDRASEYSAGSFQFTNTVAQGLYDLTVTLGVSVPTVNTFLVLAVYKNGVAFRYVLGEHYNADCNLSVNARLMLSLGDVIDLRMYASNAATVQSGQDRSNLSIERVK